MRHLLAGGLVISELLAANDNDLRDEDRDRSDWIEVLNTGTDLVDLEGWFLTDDVEDLQKWQFPHGILDAGARTIVFASGKDRAQPGSELHTSFKLSAGGEYLALVEPDGSTVAFEYAPQYPPQVSDVSFGLPQAVSALPLHSLGNPARVLIPASDQLGFRWTEVDFDDATWIDGATGVGYSSSSEFDSVIQTDVKAEKKGVNSSAYLRLPFHVEDPSSLCALTVSIRYNDGYVAFLNGVKVAEGNAPVDLAWNSAATRRRDKTESLVPEEIELASFLGVLHGGDNVLAIQGLSSDVRNSRFLIAAELTAAAAGALRADERHYFAHPTAGVANGLGTTTAIVDVAHVPRVPAADDDLLVTGTVISTAGAVAPVEMHYQVMFGSETTCAMFDDGAHGDGEAGDGVYGATIPAGVAAPGEMIRYRMTAGESAEHSGRSPVFADPLDTEQYFGTVVQDPSMQSNLPVLHLFVADVAASETSVGTHGSLFYDGDFYDNVEIDVSGNKLGRTGPKKSHDIFAARDHWFEFHFDGGQLRMDDFDILSDYWNRSKVRIPLAHETWRNMGTPTHRSLPIRVERNGEFHGTYAFVDGGNERFLEHAGLNPSGALYKMPLAFSPVGGFKKQTREYEGYSDLEALFEGLGLATQKARTEFLFDNVNIPAMVNFAAGLVITAHEDCCSRNIYAYCDTEGTGEWELLPYDFDNNFGRGGVGDNVLHPQSVDVTPSDRDNRLLAALLADVPDFRAMYLRRLRTLLDTFLQPPGTPAEELRFEQRIDEMVAQMAPDARLDFETWGSWPTSLTGEVPTWEEQVDILRNEYFPRRRVFLYGLVGDMDFSGTVDADDIDDFVWGLADPVGYEARYGAHPSLRGNQDSDLDLDFDDIPGFVALVHGASQTVPLLPAAQVGTPEIRFGTVEHDPVSGNQDEEFVELINPNDLAVDISGWTLRGGIEYTFAAGVVLPAGGTLYVSPNVNAFRSRRTGPSGGQAVFVQGDYSGHISNRGETIELVGTDGALVATATTPAAPSFAHAQAQGSAIPDHAPSSPRGSAAEEGDFEGSNGGAARRLQRAGGGVGANPAANDTLAGPTGGGGYSLPCVASSVCPARSRRRDTATVRARDERKPSSETTAAVSGLRFAREARQRNREIEVEDAPLVDVRVQLRVGDQ